MIKLFEQYNNEQEIRDICSQYNITNYTINDDMSIDVDGDVNLVGYNLTKSPIVFNNVSRSFFISTNKLTTLEGCPKHITRDFYIHNNELTNLNHSPEYVGGKYRCDGNKLTTLEGCPKNIHSVFDCSGNLLTNLKGGPTNIIDFYYCNSNSLTSLEGSPNEVDNFCASDNKLTSLKYIPKVNNYIEINENPLPFGINLRLHKISLIIKHQDEYGIWNNDGSFNKGRWDIFVKDLENEVLKND